MALIDHLVNAPFVFPSVGPTAFHFFSRPMGRVAAPRNALAGHLIGGACGLLSLAVFGLLGRGSVLSAGVGTPRILAITLSMALTAGLLVYLDVEHPPAASTTLMFSLGFMSSLKDLAVLMVAVALVTVQAIVINWRAGFPYPLWSLQPHLLESYQSESKRNLPQSE